MVGIYQILASFYFNALIALIKNQNYYVIQILAMKKKIMYENFFLIDTYKIRI